MPYTIAKQWYESKTVWLNVVTFGVALLAILAADELFAPYAKYLVLAQSVLNLVMRLLTGQPITSGPGGRGFLGLLMLCAVLAMPAAAEAQIKAEASYALHEPIALTCDITAQQGESIVYLWMIPEPAQSMIVDSGKQAHIWAKAGRYKATVFAVVTDWETKTQSQRQFTTSFTVTGTTPTTPTDPTDPNPDPPPPASELEAVVRKALASVPEHGQKQITAQALAGIFREVGKQHAAGTLSTANLFPTLDTAIDTVLNVFGTAGHWAGFRQTVKAEINARKLTPAQVPLAFEQIAAGLTNDEEALIDIAPHVMALIQAIIAKDQAAILQAVIKLVMALIAGI